MFYALKTALITPFDSGVMGPQLGTVFTLLSLFIWWLLSRLGKTSSPSLVGVGIVGGVSVKLTLKSELPSELDLWPCGSRGAHQIADLANCLCGTTRVSEALQAARWPAR